MATTLDDREGRHKPTGPSIGGPVRAGSVFGVYRFLLRPSWLAFLGVCLVLAATFVGLGFWQLDRLAQRRAINATVAAARSAPPRPVAEALSTSTPPPGKQVYTQVRAVGRYDTQHEYLVRSRTVDSRPGLLVLTPLVSRDGRVLFVARGWIPPNPKGADVAPEVPAAPSGEVIVVGRIRSSESGSDREAKVGDRTEIAKVNLAALGSETGSPTYQGYVELVRQDPAAGRAPVLIPPPDVLDEGPHLSYAVQWFSFALLTFVGYGIFAWRGAHKKERVRRPSAPAAAYDPSPDMVTVDNPPPADEGQASRSPSRSR